MEGNVKVKVQTNSTIAIHQGDSTVTIHPLKMHGFIQDLGLVKRRATQLKPEKIRIVELSYQPEKLHTEALLEVLSKAIAEEINTVKNECMACFEPAVQVRFYHLSDPQKKVNCNFDNALQLMDLWLANKTAFVKTKDKIQVAKTKIFI